MSRWPGVDPFLSHIPDDPSSAGEPESFARGAERDGGDSQAGRAQAMSKRWPVLVRLPHEKYVIPLTIVQEFKETYRSGTVLSGRGSKAALTALGRLDGVIVEVSRDGGVWELDTSVRTVRGRDVAAPDSHTVEDRCIVGIIDGGIDPLHQAFLGRDGETTRLLFIWDQTGSNGPPPTKLGFQFDYGVIYEAKDINAALKASSSLVIPPYGPADERIHGTHVASIAAGRRSVDANGNQTCPGGMAPDAPIVFVVPALQAGDGGRVSQGFAKSHIDALSFMNAVARLQALPTVVNVSAGIAAGAHDGSSLLESAFDNFTASGHAAGRAIVKSAGNAQEAKQYGRVALANGGNEVVHVEPLRPASRQCLVEAWFSSAHEIELTVAEGGGPASVPLSQRNPVVGHDTKYGRATLSYERFHRDNGDSQILVWLPKSDDNWTLALSGVAVRGSCEIDLWIEGPALLQSPSLERTLTVPGSARTVITVASSDRGGELIANTSSRGPTRDGRHKPELFAPGREIRAALADSGRDSVVLSGTSMAAPHVTGAIALLFSRQTRLGRMLPNAAQTSAALAGTARGRDGTWRPDSGYGLLDTEALLAAFDGDPLR